MSKQDKSSSKTGAGKPKLKNPGLEVVNIYGSGPLPVGLRAEPEPKGEDPGREAEATGENRGALSTSQQGGGRQRGAVPDSKK